MQVTLSPSSSSTLFPNPRTETFHVVIRDKIANSYRNTHTLVYVYNLTYVIVIDFSFWSLLG